MPTTEGGFFASPDPDALGIVTMRVAGVEFPAGVASFAVPLLSWVARQVHENVEPIHGGWCWGYNFRAVVGATVLSDHAGGVAIDYNAPSHPRGVRNTWSPAQELRIRGILAEANKVDRVIAWGEDFNTTDGMHFACRGTKAQVIAAGKRLNERDWWDDVTRDEAKTLIDNRIEAAIPAIAAACAKELLDTPVTDPVSGDDKSVRTIVRYANWRMRNTITKLGGSA